MHAVNIVQYVNTNFVLHVVEVVFTVCVCYLLKSPVTSLAVKLLPAAGCTYAGYTQR
jgi:hypothetical protein